MDASNSRFVGSIPSVAFLPDVPIARITDAQHAQEERSIFLAEVSLDDGEIVVELGKCEEGDEDFHGRARTLRGIRAAGKGRARQAESMVNERGTNDEIRMTNDDSEGVS